MLHFMVRWTDSTEVIPFWLIVFRLSTAGVIAIELSEKQPSPHDLSAQVKTEVPNPSKLSKSLFVIKNSDFIITINIQMSTEQY